MAGLIAILTEVSVRGVVAKLEVPGQSGIQFHIERNEFHDINPFSLLSNGIYTPLNTELNHKQLKKLCLFLKHRGHKLYSYT